MREDINPKTDSFSTLTAGQDLAVVLGLRDGQQRRWLRPEHDRVADREQPRLDNNVGRGYLYWSFAMKPPSLLILVAAFLLTFAALAVRMPSPPTGAVSLSWTASPSPGVTNYSVFYGTNSGLYVLSFDVGTNTSCNVSNLTRGIPWYFAVNCTDGNTVSQFSNEAMYYPSNVVQSPAMQAPVKIY